MSLRLPRLDCEAMPLLPALARELRREDFRALAGSYRHPRECPAGGRRSVESRDRQVAHDEHGDARECHAGTRDSESSLRRHDGRGLQRPHHGRNVRDPLRHGAGRRNIVRARAEVAPRERARTRAHRSRRSDHCGPRRERANRGATRCRGGGVSGERLGVRIRLTRNPKSLILGLHEVEGL